MDLPYRVEYAKTGRGNYSDHFVVDNHQIENIHSWMQKMQI